LSIAGRRRIGFSERRGREYQRGGGDDRGKGRGHDPRHRGSASHRSAAGAAGTGAAGTGCGREFQETDCMTAEHIKHWRVGDVEIARIVEVNAFEDNIAMLLKDESAEFVKQHGWLQPHFATPEGLMKISFQAFVLRSRGKSVMIDTCIGADRKREYDVFCNLKTTFLEDLAAAGFPAESITRCCARTCISITWAGIRGW
jgi:hypothetical protein